MSVFPRKRPEYYEYIQSDQWRQRANEAKQRAGHRCQICNRSSSEVTLDAHHRTYERLGNELPGDITVLCRDCHQLFETNKKTLLLPVSKSSTFDSMFASQTEETSLFRLVEADNITDNDIFSEFENEMYPDELDPAKHLLAKIGSAVYIAGYVGSAFLFLIIEWSLILNNWLQLLNPAFHLTVVWTLITSPVFWQFVVVTLVGIGLTFVGVHTVSFVQPKDGTLRWYWKWGGSAFVKVPFFLLVVANSIQGFIGLATSMFLVVGENLSLYDYPLIVPVLRLYIALLPLPLVHLIWSNKFKAEWTKLIITIISLIASIVLSFAVESWWMKMLCVNNLVDQEQCISYENFFQLPYDHIQSLLYADFLPSELVASAQLQSNNTLPTPTSTPATAQERYSIYWEDLQVQLARLKRDVWEIENAKEDKAKAFLLGTMVSVDMIAVERIPIPTDKDLQSLGYPTGLHFEHQQLLSVLRPCSYLGALGMDMETVSLKDFLSAQQDCKKTITDLEKRDEIYIKLFRCPYAHPLCSN